MKPTTEQLTSALLAASKELPPGLAIVYLVVATEEGDHSVISSASNVASKDTKRRLLELERINLDVEPGAPIQSGGRLVVKGST